MIVRPLRTLLAVQGKRQYRNQKAQAGQKNMHGRLHREGSHLEVVSELLLGSCNRHP